MLQKTFLNYLFDSSSANFKSDPIDFNISPEHVGTWIIKKNLICHKGMVSILTYLEAIIFKHPNTRN